MSLQNIYKEKKVLVTGHTGFKGSWLTAILKRFGAEVAAISLDPHTDPSHLIAANLHQGIRDVRADILNADEVATLVEEFQPDFVFHLAAQALVRPSYEFPVDTWQVNVMGTIHVLEALRHLNKPCTSIMITSDKCYDNVEWVWGYRETDALGGPDPYSASKGAAELAIRSYIKSYFHDNSKVRIASARAGNVIGGGDWADDRIVPDCMRAWSAGGSVDIRNPVSTRPWQHVLEPLRGYLMQAAELSMNENLHGEAFNFGPLTEQNYSVISLVQQMSKHWDSVKWNDVSASRDGPYESNLLKLNCDKALVYLKWRPLLNFEETVRYTVEWYKSYYEYPENIVDQTNRQIDEFFQTVVK